MRSNRTIVIGIILSLDSIKYSEPYYGTPFTSTLLQVGAMGFAKVSQAGKESNLRGSGYVSKNPIALFHTNRYFRFLARLKM